MVSMANMPLWFFVVLAITGICLAISFWGIWHAYWRDFPTIQEKMIWLVVIIFIPFVGGVAYLGWGRNRARKRA